MARKGLTSDEFKAEMQKRRASASRSSLEPLTQLTGSEQIDLFNYYMNTTMGKTPTDAQKAAYEKFSSASGGSGDTVLPSISADFPPPMPPTSVESPSLPPKPDPRPSRSAPLTTSQKDIDKLSSALGPTGEGQFALERTPGDELQPLEKQMQTMMGEAEPGGPEDAPAMATLRSRDEEIAAREPLGESAGRLAIQNFMERNFGFRPTVTFDVEEQEPGS